MNGVVSDRVFETPNVTLNVTPTVTLNRFLSLRAGRVALLMVMLVLLLAGAARAQDRRQNEAGQFDFYVLSLSWSPSFCEAAAERSSPSSGDPQCGERR